jgi:hypothetical protein
VDRRIDISISVTDREDLVGPGAHVIVPRSG